MNVLTFQSEEIICHEELIEDGKKSVECRVIVRFKDQDGNEWECNKVITCGLKKVERPV